MERSTVANQFGPVSLLQVTMFTKDSTASIEELVMLLHARVLHRKSFTAKTWWSQYMPVAEAS